jgi:hypothetical protein
MTEHMVGIMVVVVAFIKQVAGDADTARMLWVRPTLQHRLAQLGPVEFEAESSITRH